MTPLDIQTSGVALFSVESTDDNAVQWRIQSDSTNRRLVALDGAGNTETQIVLLDNGAIEFVGPTTGDPIAQLDSSGNLHIEGVCTQGTPAVPCGS